MIEKTQDQDEDETFRFLSNFNFGRSSNPSDTIKLAPIKLMTNEEISVPKPISNSILKPIIAP